LEETWPYWDVIEVVVPYVHVNVKSFVEEYRILYTISDVLRLMGFPTSNFFISPGPNGVSNVEWAVSIPDYVLEGLKNRDLLIGPGNTIGLYSCRDGLIKDGVKIVSIYPFPKVILMNISS